MNGYGRYVYVSPEIVARMMFEAGWNRWAHHEPEAFLEKLPDALFDAFLKRVERSAEPQVRRVVAAHFRRWLEALSSTDLRDAEKVKRARLLVEADVDANLRLLEHVVRAASIDDLREVTGTRGWGGGWGPRRHLVWLLESVVRLPQCFHAVEAMLRRLAKAESEPGIGNNATAIHQQIFGIYLSGTPLPFDTRVKVLEDSLTNDGDDDRLLTVAVLEVVLKGHHSRSGGTTFVGGTLPPPEWRPTSSEEVMNATRRIVSLLVLASNDHAINVARAAAAALAQNTRRLLYGGFLRELQAVFAAREKALSFGSNILREIDAYLRWDNPGGASPEQDEYRSTVQKWAASLVPPDIEGRLVRYIGPGASIAGDGNAAEWATALEALVSDLTTGDTLTQHLDWLSSEEARGAVYVGAGIGRIDPEGTRLAMVIDAAARSGETAFARGYCVGYASLGSTQMRRISEAIDGIDDAAPTVAFEISVQVEALDACIARALRAVDAGTLPAAVLSSHRFEYDAEPLLPHDGERMLRTLLRAVTSGDELATRGSAHLLSSWSQATHGQPHLFEDGAFREAAWALIEALCEHRGTDGYHWEQAIGHLAKFDYNRAVLVGVTGLAGESLQISTAAENILIRFAPDHGDKIVDQLGKTLLDEERGWRFRVRSLRVLTSSLPAERFIQWLSQVGVDGARHLARHLETPTLADDGRVLVSPLTEYVLTTFADDDETFEEFVSGSHAMQVYQGDIAALHEAEADAARAMLNHPVRRIREWAAREVQSAEAGAARWRRYDDELPTDF